MSFHSGAKLIYKTYGTAHFIVTGDTNEFKTKRIMDVEILDSSISVGYSCVRHTTALAGWRHVLCEECVVFSTTTSYRRRNGA